MSNKYNTDLKSKIIELQAKYIFDKMYAKLGTTYSVEQINAAVAEAIKRFYVHLGRPLTILRPADSDHLPFLEDYNDIIEEIVGDSSILYGEIEALGNSLSTNFNYIQSEQQRITNRIKGIGALTTDLNLLANETTANSMYIRDSFNDESHVEPKMILANPAQISTLEGIVTLGRTTTLNRSIDSSIKLIQGDGESGTQHIARSIAVSTNIGTFTPNAIYLYTQTPNDDSKVMIDGRPDTVFEYQMVNTTPDNIINTAKSFDFEWAKGQQTNDKLRLKVIIQLKDTLSINWININPYSPQGSTGKVMVYSIRTSEDGFTYNGLYSDGDFIINAQLNITPQTYRQDSVFDGSNNFNASKFAGQGVWSFPTRNAKYVEIVFDQVESYLELIGHTYYEKVTQTKDTSGKIIETSVRVPAFSVSENIIASPPGRYLLKDNIYINKNIDLFNGWRYVIGIRDINIMSYQFVERSELITKRFTLDNTIKEVMLYANEKIPQAFLDDLNKVNDWIQYYFSLDDVTWYRISPVHQNPVAGQTFSPKIYSINESNLDLQSSFQLYKGYITTALPPKAIRLKVVLQRPTNITDATSFTPILEDYALRIVFDNGK